MSWSYQVCERAAERAHDSLRYDVEAFFGEALKGAQSPIEEALRSTLLSLCIEKFEVVVVVAEPGRKIIWPSCAKAEFDFESCDWPIDVACLEMAKHIGKYRPDIFLRWHRGSTCGPPQRKSMVIECDGHYFHERTKEQALHDRERDRFMQSEGHLVFRFPGSAIYKDAFKCADECLTALGSGSGE